MSTPTPVCVVILLYKQAPYIQIILHTHLNDSPMLQRILVPYGMLNRGVCWGLDVWHNAECLNTCPLIEMV